MKLYLIIILGLFFSYSASAAEKKYPVSELSDDMTSGAKSVVRTDENTLTVNADGSAVLSCVYAVTVLNENGKEEGYFSASYNKLMRYRKLAATIYDKNGDRERKIKQDEIYDVSNIASYSLFEDSRAKIIQPISGKYPYTVEYSFEIVLESVLSYPPWSIVPGYNIPIQYSNYKVILPKDKKLRYHGSENIPEPVIESDGESTSYFWEIKNLPAIKDEPYTLNPRNFLPILMLSPEEVTYGGRTGIITSWDEFGKWTWDLIADKSDFLPEAEAEILALVKDCKTDEEKVATLYKYMQDKVRYVNISIGIGGLEPIEAQRVHEVSYGDCKALTNYMRSMLKVVGIESVYTLVMAGSSHANIIKEFPSQQFNHVILTVPQENDTIWLECTSQRLPPDYLGTFTDNRTVLFVTEEGGKLGRSPHFSAEENHITTTAKISINEYLDANLTRERKYEGNEFDNIYSKTLYLDAIEQERSIQNQLDLSGFKLVSFNYETSTSAPVYVKEKIEVEDDAIISSSGDYILLPTNLVSTKISLPTRVRKREQKLYLSRCKVLTDSILIEIPENLEVYQIPEDVSIESEFGAYTSSTKKVDGGVLYTRRVEFKKGLFSPEKYSDFYSYYREMNKADSQELMLKIK